MQLCLLLVACHADHSPESVARSRTKAGVDVFCAAIETYRVEHSKLPEASRGLLVLIAESHRTKSNPILADEWGQPIQPFISDLMLVGAYSTGANRSDDGGAGDDIGCRVEE